MWVIFVSVMRTIYLYECDSHVCSDKNSEEMFDMNCCVYNYDH